MTPEKQFRDIRKELILLGLFCVFAILVVSAVFLKPEILTRFFPTLFKAPQEAAPVITEPPSVPPTPEVPPILPPPLPVPPAVEIKVVPQSILVDDFDLGATRGVFKERFNALGSFQGTFSKRPSYTVLSKSSSIRRGDKGRSLVIEYNQTEGWCGYYTLLAGIDISEFNTLSFWVKGEAGGENFDIGLSDQRMQDLEIDAVYVGAVNNYLPQGVNATWQEVKIPLTKIAADINLKEMGSFVLFFRYPGKGKIYLEDIMFKNDPEIERIVEENYPRAKVDPGYPRSLWLWKVDPAQNLKAREEIIQLCKRTAIEILYLYIGDFSEEDDPEYTQGLVEFLREAHAHGLQVEALTGSPIWQLEEHHETALNWVRTFLEFNQHRPPPARIDGISLDVEPYLAQEWNEDREGVKAAFITLLQKVRALIDEYPDQEFRFGVVAPIFYDAEGPDFERAIFQEVDYVALMDYYDTAQEIISNAEFHLKLADEMGKHLVIGIETQDLVAIKQGGRRNTFFEEGWEDMERILEEISHYAKQYQSFEGFAIHYYVSYKNLQKGRNVPTKEREVLYTIPALKAHGSITVDGDLSEWRVEEAPLAIREKEYVVYGQGAWRGEEDLSLETLIQWDEEMLYLGAQITDDVVAQAKSGKEMWEGDHIELWLDMNLEADYTEAVNSQDDFQLGLSPGNFDTLEPEVYLWTPPLDPELLKEVIVKARKEERGYTIEAQIPAKILFATARDPARRQKTFQAGDRFGISIDLSDTDDVRMPQKCLMSTSSNRVWGDPTTFGVLELQ